MPNSVAQVRAVMAGLGLERPHLLGYSMGARVALSLAVAAPETIASAVLVGASPGLADEGERQSRVAADRALADRIETEGLERFVEHWMALPLFASQSCLGESALRRAREQRLRNRPHGLAFSLRGMGTGAMPPLHEALRHVEVPLCFVAGAEDAKFVALGRKLAEQVDGARFEALEAAGHAAHLEAPAAFAALASSFYEECDQPIQQSIQQRIPTTQERTRLALGTARNS